MMRDGPVAQFTRERVSRALKSAKVLGDPSSEIADAARLEVFGDTVGSEYESLSRGKRFDEGEGPIREGVRSAKRVGEPEAFAARWMHRHGSICRPAGDETVAELRLSRSAMPVFRVEQTRS